MTADLAPLHIYIYTKSYRNFKVWEWAVCEEGASVWGGECLSAAVGLSFLLITDRLDENKPGPILQPVWVKLRLQPLSWLVLLPFVCLCLLRTTNTHLLFAFLGSVCMHILCHAWALARTLVIRQKEALVSSGYYERRRETFHANRGEKNCD